MKPTRLDSLPQSMRQRLKEARLKRHWSQLALGQRVGLPQTHVSDIETGKVVPRYDTLLDLVRVLDHDLILAPRALVPAINALIHDFLHEGDGARTERLYAADSTTSRADSEPMDES